MFTKRGEMREKVLQFVTDWIEQKSYPPSIREICKGVGLRSTRAAKYHLDVLVGQGLLKRRSHRARALETASPRASLPIVGRVAAGEPIMAVENIEDIGYAKGYMFALTQWRDFLAGLDALRNERGMTCLLLAHAKAVQAYRAGGYQGEIGIVLDVEHTFPASDSAADREACARYTGHYAGLFADPLFKGRYPPQLMEWIGPRYGS